MDLVTNQSPYQVESCCRSCRQESLVDLVEFGETPLADRILKKEDLESPEIKVPLTLVHCTNCSLVQILETVDPEVLFFSEYPYFSSVSPALMKHFGASAEYILKTRNLGSDSLVVEAASNDGYLLQHFKEAGIPVLGIDPADAPAAKANEIGVETMNTFFTEELSSQLVSEGKSADVFLANNVLAHIPDLNGFVAGISTLLKDDGLAVLEMHYVVDLVDHCEFDTIYHQHVCYYSVTALDHLLRRHGLYINHVKRTTIHGGSLRVFVEKHENVDAGVLSLIKMEKDRGLLNGVYYSEFSERIALLKKELSEILGKVKSEGKTIAGYGAAAKATTLMAYCGIGKEQLEFVADLNAYKHGKYMGGNQLPILPAERVVEEQPDYLLILAWNFSKEIMSQQKAFSEAGGKFIIPVPQPKICG